MTFEHSRWRQRVWMGLIASSDTSRIQKRYWDELQTLWSQPVCQWQKIRIRAALLILVTAEQGDTSDDDQEHHGNLQSSKEIHQDKGIDPVISRSPQDNTLWQHDWHKCSNIHKPHPIPPSPYKEQFTCQKWKQKGDIQTNIKKKLNPYMINKEACN